MSLPDTVFIFVLALIIFGPKKLPEIGRQLGKLVGEFRRASNEFKFQIEEELRQAELSDRNTTAPAKKELETSASAEASTEASDSPAPDLPYSEETLPVGQYPNIDTVNPQDLTPAESTEAEAAPVSAHEQAVAENTSELPVINPATGAEPRTAPPYGATPVEADATAIASETASTQEPHPSADHISSPASENPRPNHEPADPYAAPAVADVTHG
ncbi:MAG TPA: twin-arginine translocase TatA/TatE family subunit [Acidobacteriaceae bacterium]|nr:twin-arginine translocase TatA/TatE family subunit [Acidobacteriaceae bacterium]